MGEPCVHEIVRCTICDPTIAPPEPTYGPTSRPFTARYDGRCAGCDAGIGEGDRVRYVDGQLVHEGCADG